MIWVLKVDNEVEIKYRERTLIKNLDDLETVWLRDYKFLTGDEITFADLTAASTLEQVIGLKLFTLDEQRFPRTTRWMNEVRTNFSPKFQEAHKFVYKYAL